MTRLNFARISDFCVQIAFLHTNFSFFESKECYLYLYESWMLVLSMCFLVANECT